MVKVLLVVTSCALLAAGGIDAHSIKNSALHPRSPLAFSRPQSGFTRKNDQHLQSSSAADILMGIPRGGEVATATTAASSNIVTALLSGLCYFIKGAKADTLSLLAV